MQVSQNGCSSVRDVLKRGLWFCLSHSSVCDWFWISKRAHLLRNGQPMAVYWVSSFIAGLQVPQLPKESIKRPPNPNAVAVLEKTITIQGLFIALIRDTRVLLARKGSCSELLQVLNRQGRVFVKYLLSSPIYRRLAPVKTKTTTETSEA